MKKINEVLNETLPKSISKTLSIVKLWREVCGDFISKLTVPLIIKDGILYVATSEHILKNEFSFVKDEIIERLNSFGLGIKDIRIVLQFIEKKDTESVKFREITEKEKKIVERYANRIQDENLREKFKRAMLAYFKRYSLKDFINGNLNVE